MLNSLFLDLDAFSLSFSFQQLFVLTQFCGRNLDHCFFRDTLESTAADFFQLLAFDLDLLQLCTSLKGILADLGHILSNDHRLQHLAAFAAVLSDAGHLKGYAGDLDGCQGVDLCCVFIVRCNVLNVTAFDLTGLFI